MMEGDDLDDALRAERHWARDNPEAYDRYGLPTLSTAETIGERLERLAGRLGCLDQFMGAKSQAELPEALSEHREGQELLKALERAKGGLTWSLAGEEFLRQGVIKASTGKTYMSQWSKADEANVPGPQYITRQDARDYLRKRRDKGATGSTLNTIVSAMSNVMEHLFPDDDDKKRTWRDHKIKPRLDKKAVERKDWTAEQLATLVNGVHWSVACAVKIAAHTGLRISEIYSAEWDFERRLIHVKDGKTANATRTIAMHPAIEADARRWTSDKTRHAKNTVVSYFSEHKIALGFGPETTLHSTRHSFSTALARAGVAFERRARLCGHQVQGVQSAYTHLGPEDLREDLEKIDWSAVGW